jgi:16S rRNA (adenine1518-N6/adenine1519-N6)-dimethyltransferase
VGAGPGTLTVPLAARCRRLVAVEIDTRLARLLRAATASLPQVEVVREDVLKLDLRALFPRGGQVVVGNIPYYLTGALLPKLLEPEPRPKRLSLVVQQEVAERWVSDSSWSLATVAVRVYAEPSLVLRLPAEAFSPRPKVDSALVRLEVRQRPAVEVADLGAFFRFVEQVFQFRRKQLRSSLARLSGRPVAETAERLEALGIAQSRRPETLALGEWQAVYEAFGALS